MMSSAPDTPAHRRSLAFEAFPGDSGIRIVGRLRDERPWATDARDLPLIHDLELEIEVAWANLTITAAEARMHVFPHAECPAIEAAFGSLVGLTVTGGYRRGLSERLSGVSGCAHLLELARAMGPVVVQSMYSAMAQRAAADRRPVGDDDPRLKYLALLTDTCHIWAADGVGFEKVRRGWRPGTTQYPVPVLESWPGD